MVVLQHPREAFTHAEGSRACGSGHKMCIGIRNYTVVCISASGKCDQGSTISSKQTNVERYQLIKMFEREKGKEGGREAPGTTFRSRAGEKIKEASRRAIKYLSFGTRYLHEL